MSFQRITKVKLGGTASRTGASGRRMGPWVSTFPAVKPPTRTWTLQNLMLSFPDNLSKFPCFCPVSGLPVLLSDSSVSTSPSPVPTHIPNHQSSSCSSSPKSLPLLLCFQELSSPYIYVTSLLKTLQWFPMISDIKPKYPDMV